MARFLDV
ncbi:c17a9d02-1069-4fa4-965b-85802bd2cf0d [Thermothielavioides terrestris]|nr:c17a9d02-1069-4fa4-965b-85802bd2cf0d [Thermothielavioides terrestris]